ncbi:MAG: bifunctional protein GlmU [Micavibrio sp.]|nr:MAG: bifunctional protein GlmU [Micavibrio sp.]
MSQKPLNIVILAAGKGTRMNSQGSNEQPKVMHELAGLPMINWLLKTAEQLSPEKIIVVTGPDMPELEAAAKPHTTVIQPERNGTAGAVRAALPLLEDFTGDVLVLLGDTPLIKQETLTSLIEAKGNGGLSVLGCVMDNPSGYGRLIAEKNVLKKIVEDKDASAKEKEVKLVNTGAFCVDGARLSDWVNAIGNDNTQGEYYLTDLPEIAAKNRSEAFVSMTLDEAEVRGCNTLADLAALEATLQNRLRQSAMESGARLQDPGTVYFHHDTKIGQGVTIEPNVFFGRGADIADNVTIRAFCHIEETKISEHSEIGPFARLRRGAVLAENVKIGNFVEVKNSVMAQGSKANHLAYIGDSSVGENSNIGAGTITCNYNGFEKNKTKIGSNVFIGSNAALIAPVTIGDGAIVAAGSTITEDVPADSLSMGRSKAEVKEGWAATYRKLKLSKKKSA